ncbi:hypothetical protein ACFE04_002455 [Oxalis oulophora]
MVIMMWMVTKVKIQTYYIIVLGSLILQIWDGVLKYCIYGVLVHKGYYLTSGHYFFHIQSCPGVCHKLDDEKQSQSLRRSSSKQPVKISITSLVLHQLVKFRKIDTLSKVDHRKFVNLLGFFEQEEPITKILFFGYTLNGTLFQHLQIKESDKLDRSMRLRITMGKEFMDPNPIMAMDYEIVGVSEGTKNTLRRVTLLSFVVGFVKFIVAGTRWDNSNGRFSARGD